MVLRTRNDIEEIDYGAVYVAPAVRSKFPEYDERGRMRLSVSRMQLFEKCPLAFKLSYIDHLDLSEDDESRERLDKGKELHDLFYESAFQNYPEIVRAQEIYGKFPEHGENFIWLQGEFARIYGDHRPMYAEKEIIDYDDFVVLYVDRINDIGDGTVEILDYKTGKVGPLSKHEFQLALYTYYVEKHMGLRVSKWSIFFSKDKKYKSIDVNRAKVRMIPEIIRIVRDKIDEAFSVGGFYMRPNTLCSYCSLLQFGLCKSSPNKSYNCFGLLDIYSKDWNTPDSDVRYVCGGIRVTR